MDTENLDLPEYPGPAALGHEPLIGSVRRSNDMPVIREEVVDRVDDMEAFNLPDEPVLPVLNLNR